MTANDYWPHGPIHKLDGRGMFMITAGTYQKQWFINTNEKLDFIQSLFFSLAKRYGWKPQAWVFLVNHYHFIAQSPESGLNLSEFLKQFHYEAAKRINEIDGTPHRKVWFQFRDKHLTYQKSYFARLKYVNTNPAHHGIIRNSSEYRWCSAIWFKQTAGRSFQHTIETFKTDNLKVYDDF